MKNILITIVVAVIVTLGMNQFAVKKTGTASAESTYDRVKRTGVIRCGYNIEAPMIIADPNTGKLSGANVEMAEQLAELMGLKIEWTERVAWQEMPIGLVNNRYDLVCNGKWVFAPQSQGGQYTAPLYFTAVHAYGRADETRFDENLSQLNDPQYTVTSMDGEINYFVAHTMFPRAKQFESPALTDPTQLILNVTSNKADVTFQPAYLGQQYDEKNPGEIKKLSKRPLVVFDTAFMLKAGEAAFAGALDTALREMQGKGMVNAILDKYGVSPENTLRVADPYKLP